MKVVGITGKRRSGKDTFVKFCSDLLEDEDLVVIPFAEELHSVAVLYVFYDYLKDKGYPNIDLGEIVEAVKEDRSIYCSEPDFTELATYLIVNDLQPLTDVEMDFIRKIVVGKPINIAYRKFLQYFGTDIVRKRDKLFWINKVYEKIRNYQKVHKNFICFISDVRFFNEAYFVKMLDGILVYIERPSICDNDCHLSECQIEEIGKKLADFHIINRNLDDLRETANGFVRKFLI